MHKNIEELTDIEISTFQANCKDCGNTFDYPSFGDFSYGKFIFNTEDGKSFVFYDFSTPIELLFKVLLPENCGRELYLTALAEFADPVFGRKVTSYFCCGICKSQNLQLFDGNRTGSMWVKPLTYNQLQLLSKSEIIEKFAKFVAKKKA